MSDEPAETSSPKPPATAHRWRRRIILALAILAVVSIIARVVVNFALPSVLRRIASGYDLTCSYERSEMNLLSGDAGLWHLAFSPKSGGDPVLQLDYVRGNISTLALLRGRLDVWRMEADGVDVLVERTADGHIPLLERLLSKPLPVRAVAAPGKASVSSNPQVDFNPPLKLDAFRLSHVRARVIDRTVSPATDATVTLNARVSDVQSDVRPITFELDFWTDPLLDLIRVEGTAKAAGKTLEADVRLMVRGFHPRELAAYLTPFGVNPVSRSIAMEGRGQVKLVAISTAPPPPPSAKTTTPRYDALSGELSLRDISIRTESDEAVGVDRVEIKADSIGFDAAKFADLLVEGVRLTAGASEKGVVRFAGFEIAPISGSTTKPGPTVASSSPPSTQPAINYRVALGQATLRKMRTAFEDRSVTPPAQLSFDVDDLTAKNLTFDPSQPDVVLDIGGRMHSSEMAQSIVIAAKVAPFAQKKTMTLSVNVEGIKPDAVKPYLTAAGFQSELRQGSFVAEINGELTQKPDGRLAASGQVAKLRFADGSELLAMNDVKLNGIGMDAQTGALRVDAIDISGPSIVASRNAAGEISVVGMRWVNPAPSSPSAPTTAPAATSSRVSLIALPKFQIGRLSWKDVKFQFDDAMVSPPVSISLADAGIEMNDLVVGAAPGTSAQKPGSIKAWLTAPGVVGRATVEGSLTPLPAGVTTDVQVAATGITGNAIKTYLLALGIEPQLEDGKLEMHAKASLNQLDDGVAASLNLDKVSYLDGTKELAGADAVRIDDVSLKPEGLIIGAVELDRPRSAVLRDAQGLFSAAGIKLLRATSSEKPSIATPSTQPATPGIPLVAVLKHLRVNDGAMAWSDQTSAGSVNTTGHATIQLDGLTIGRPADPATFTITASADGVLDRSQVSGKLTTSPDSLGIEMDASADGVKIGPLAPYLPPSIEVPLRDGRLRAVVSAVLTPNQQGGHAVRISARDVSLADGAADPPVLKITSFSAIAPRVDPEGGAIDIDQIMLAGFETDIRQSADGALHLPGVILLSDSKASPATQPALTASAPTTTRPAQDVAALVAAARKPPPLVKLNQLDLGFSRVSVQSELLPGSAPLVLNNVRIRNVDRVEVGGPDSAARPPAQFELTGALDPAIDSLKISAKLSPLAQQPGAVIDVDLSGIHGDVLKKLLPQTGPYVDGEKLKEGQLRTHLELSGKFARHGPADFDLTKPFDLDVQLNGTEYRAAPDGPLLAGLEALHADAVHVDPATGSTQIKTLEITKPAGNIWREKDGIHVLGWVVKIPGTTGDSPTTAPASATTAAPIAQSESKRPEAELRIDRLLMSGLDARIEDRSVDPPVILPLNGLDVEVRNISNMAMYEDRPIRFSAVVTSGKAELPNMKKGSEGQLENREVFSQVTASGKVSLYPQSNGWIKASVSGFELSSLRGLAHENGITLGKGIFDGNFDLRFKPDSTIDVRSKLVVTDLQISEPAGGPIQRAMGLPGTLDVVIKALQDPDESITVPLNFPVPQGKISEGAIVGAAAGAFASVAVTALASAPVKVVGGVGDLLVMPGAKKPAEQQPVGLSFGAGVVDLDLSSRQALDQLKQQMAKDKNVELTIRHELGGGDLTRAEIRANPSIEECQNLAYQLRNRKMQLLSQRSQLAGEARGTIAAAPNSPDAVQVLAQLRDLDRQIAQNEDALDQVYDLLKPGADRQAARRTRAAGLELAQQRMDAVRDYLNLGVATAAGERIRTINPTFAAPDDPASNGKIVITIIAKKKQ